MRVLNMRKSPGASGIPAELLKDGGITKRLLTIPAREKTVIVMLMRFTRLGSPYRSWGCTIRCCPLVNDLARVSDKHDNSRF